MPLRFLTIAEVSQYLAGRFGPGAIDELLRQSVAQLVHQSSDGNPLFMVMLVDYLVAQGVIRGAAGRWQVETRLWFTEGFDTKDLREATTLLEEFS
ncbi:MAG TPA: hypothetical protein VNN62_12385 [Methylomirabilota bacterium]|nr:hypothetical protein [Methylomirabilota bacterium]